MLLSCILHLLVYLNGVDTGENKLKKHKILKSCPVIGLKATEEEQMMFNLIRRVRKFPSNAHLIRVLVNEEYEKILSQKSPIGVVKGGKHES